MTRVTADRNGVYSRPTRPTAEPITDYAEFEWTDDVRLRYRLRALRVQSLPGLGDAELVAGEWGPWQDVD